MHAIIVVMNFDHLQNRFEKPTSKVTSERASLIEMFVTRLNKDRTGKYKPLPSAFYATKMALIPTDELYMFYKELDRSNSFSKLWWWKVKNQKPVDKLKQK